MPKVFIGVGHGGRDVGAIKYVKESDANLYMALGLKEELERHGVVVGISRIKDENDPLSEEIQEANAFKPDVAVEVHNNAGGGDGFEVYRQTNGYSSKSIKLAGCIEKRVKAHGQNSRGIKTKLNGSGTDYFGWLRQVKAPAVLCEGFFVDNAKDVADFDTVAEQEAYGKAYARGVLDYFGISVKAPTESVRYDYTVQVGAFSKSENAMALSKKLTSMGYSVRIVGAGDVDMVYVGKFITKPEAEKTANDLKKKGFDGFVKKVV